MNDKFKEKMNINNDKKKYIVWTHIHITVVRCQMSFLSTKQGQEIYKCFTECKISAIDLSFVNKNV